MIAALETSLDGADIESLAALLRAVARKCECELGTPDPEVCVSPPDRWELRWAEGAL